MNIWAIVRRWVPPGVGVIFSPAYRRGMIWSVLGSIGLSLLDTLGVLATLPLLQLLTGVSVDTGPSGVMMRLFGLSSRVSLAWVIASIVVVLFTSKSIISYFFRKWQGRFVQRMQAETATVLLRRFLDAPYSFHLSRTPAELLQTVNATVGMAFGYVAAWTAIVVDGFNLAMILGTLLVISPIPAFGAVLFFGVAAVVMSRITRRRAQLAGSELILASSGEYRAAMRALYAVKEIKLRHASRQFTAAFERARKRSAEASIDAAMAAELPRYVFDALFVVGVAALTVALLSLQSSSEALVILGLFVAAGSRLMPTITRLLGSLNALRVGDTPLRTLIGELETLTRIEKMAPSLEDRGRQPQGDVVVEDLWFAYEANPDVDVLKGVNMTVPQGSSFALVGASGVGKSTLVDVLMGLQVPTRGRITVGGEDIFENLKGWQDSLAVVPQDVWVGEESMLENITFIEFGQPVDSQRLEDAIEAAQLGPVIETLEEGLGTWLGSEGTRLSGGQKQRVGIARALYRRPEILLLDEATSALDNKTEKSFTDTIEALRGRITVIVVAHRLSTVRGVDQLGFMVDGRIRTVGTFEEVASADPDFAELVRLAGMRGQDAL